MLFEIMLSLRLFLAEKIPELNDVQFIYDGVKLSELQKPFVTIESLNTPTEYVSAGRKSVREIYSFQVGVFTDDFTPLIMTQEKVKETLQSEVDLCGADLAKTGDTFVCNVSDFTPIRNDDLANVTNNFRGYFDVSVELYRDVGTKIITQ